MSNELFNEFGFAKIVKTARIEKGNDKGWLIWDAFLINEITFQDDVIHKNTVLWRCWSDLEASDKFDALIKAYNGRFVSTGSTGVKNAGIIIASEQYETKLRQQAEAFIKDCEKWKNEKKEYEDLIKKYKDYIEELEKERDKNQDTIIRIQTELKNLQNCQTS